MGVRLALVGELDVANCDSVLAEFLAAVDGAPGFVRESMAGLVIDCAALTFIDSSGLAMLVTLREKTGLQLVLTNVSQQCRLPFELTRLDAVFDLR